MPGPAQHGSPGEASLGLTPQHANSRTCLALYQVTDHKINFKKRRRKEKNWKGKKGEVGDSVRQKERIRKRHGCQTIDDSFEGWRRWNANSSKGQVFFHHSARDAAGLFRLPPPLPLSWSRVFAVLLWALCTLLHLSKPLVVCLWLIFQIPLGGMERKTQQEHWRMTRQTE